MDHGDWCGQQSTFTWGMEFAARLIYFVRVFRRSRGAMKDLSTEQGGGLFDVGSLNNCLAASTLYNFENSSPYRFIMLASVARFLWLFDSA